MKNSLLAHIASHFISEYENVANSSIAYLLNHYSAARKALQAISLLDDVPQCFVTELVTKSNGRPDVTGLNEEGDKQVIIEGKFWANLTDNQPTNYLKELAKNGRVIFLTPHARIESLKIELRKRAGQDFGKIIICSWSNFLKQIETENNKNSIPQLTSDLFQIKELCQKMDTDGMPPLSNSDLDSMNGKRLTYFADIIDECNQVLRQWKYADFKGVKTVSTKYGHGFYFRAYHFGCFLGFDCKRWYRGISKTPFWLVIADYDFKESMKINNALKSIELEKVEDDETDHYKTKLALVLQSGMDKEQAINEIVNQTQSILGFLNEKVT
jgi:hypothetical protein